MNNNEMLKALIESTKAERIAAERKFEKDKNEFLGMVSSTVIQITDLSPLKDILSKIRLACESFYASCEGLLRTFHQECGNYTDSETPSSVLREISAEMAEIISDCHISLNFDGKLDGIDLGDLGTIELTASMEAQSIARMWESKSNIRKSIEEKTAQQKRDAAYAEANRIAPKDAAKHRKYLNLLEELETVQNRKEAGRLVTEFNALNGYLDSKVFAERAAALEAEFKERDIAAAKERQRQTQTEKAAREKEKRQIEAVIEAYYAKEQAWAGEVERIKAAREKNLVSRVDARAAELKKEYEQRFSAEKDRIETETEAAEIKKELAQKTLASLGAFKFSEKKTQKNLIAEAEAVIEQAKGLLSDAERELELSMENLPEELDRFKDTESRTVDSLYPLPPAPEKPPVVKEREAREERKKAETKRLAAKLAKEKKDNAIYISILKAMNGYREYRHTEIKAMVPELAGDSGTSRTDALCRRLLIDGFLNRSYDAFRVTRFGLASDKESVLKKAMEDYSMNKEPEEWMDEEEKAEKKEKEEELLMEKVYSAMSPGRLYRISEIMELLPDFSKANGLQYASVICRKMDENGLLLRTAQNTVLYYEKV